jgi:hypothetical protein
MFGIVKSLVKMTAGIAIIPAVIVVDVLKLATEEINYTKVSKSYTVRTLDYVLTNLDNAVNPSHKI